VKQITGLCRVRQKGWPPMNADQPGLTTQFLSALICVDQRLEISFRLL
jgi:hypothetical protein